MSVETSPASRPALSRTILALVVATLAAGSAAPALAQDHGPRGERQMHERGHGHERGMRVDRQGGPRLLMHRGAGGLFAIVCSPRGADRLEHRLLDIAQRADPTGDQVGHYDTFKDAALAAQADFAATCETARADGDAAATSELPDRLRAGLELQQAHLDAMNAVLPAFEAFYDSLGDEQKQAMQPQRRHAGRGGPGGPMMAPRPAAEAAPDQQD